MNRNEVEGKDRRRASREGSFPAQRGSLHEMGKIGALYQGRAQLVEGRLDFSYCSAPHPGPLWSAWSAQPSMAALCCAIILQPLQLDRFATFT